MDVSGLDVPPPSNNFSGIAKGLTKMPLENAPNEKNPY
jgi:hypothetical protein